MRIVHKIESLDDDDDRLRGKNLDRPERSDALTAAVACLDAHPGKDLPKAEVRKLLG